MANVTITDLSAGSALAGSELFEIVQTGASVKTTASAIKTFVNTSATISGGTASSTTISSATLNSCTINAATGSFGSLTITTGAIPFSTITNRAYAQFESTSDQTAASANVTYTASVNSAASFNTGITVASSTNVTVAAAGTYMVTTSIQWYNANTSDHNATFWFGKNGTAIANSASKLTIPKAADGGQALAQVTIYEQCNASDYIQLLWQVDDTDVRMDYTAASGVIPAIPSVIFNISRIA